MGVAWGLLCAAVCVVRCYKLPPPSSSRSGRCSTLGEPKKSGSSCLKSCNAKRKGKPAVAKEDLPPSKYLNESANIWRLCKLDDAGIVSSGGISYTVTDGGMAVTMGAAQTSPAVGRLDAGATVTVLELIEATNAKLGRVLRGRITKPPGWITLESIPCNEAQSVASDVSTATPQGSSLAYSSSSSERSAASADSSSQTSLSSSSQTSLSSSSSGGSTLDSAAPMPEEPLTRLPPRSPCCAPGRRQREEDPRAPALLCLVSPNGQRHCEGNYELTLGRRANGQPLWRQHGGGNWLFANPAGKWCVGGEDAEKGGFRQSLGWITQTQAHSPGEMPDVSCTQWQRWDGNAFREDAQIRVYPTLEAVSVTTLAASGSQSSEGPLEPQHTKEDHTATREQRKWHSWFRVHRLKKVPASLEPQCCGRALDLRGAADVEECRQQWQTSSYTSVII